MWDNIADDMDDEGRLPKTLPWDHIISLTTFGKAVGDHQHFWNSYVVWPCQSPGNHKVMIKELEGSDTLPGDDAPYGSGRAARGRRGGKGRVRSASPGLKGARSDRSTCSAWNAGGCVAVGQCPSGDKHGCNRCGGGHRGRDCPKGKGKSGGKGKAKGAGKGSKGKFSK